jgi:hypothetical protein
MTSAVYVPSKGLVYVLLGNTDFTRVANGYMLLCTALKPSIIAIDVNTDTVKSLGGTAPGGGIALDGYNPSLGTPLYYDAALDRILVLQDGCNLALDDGGVGAIAQRRVEAVELATGTVKTLLSLDDQDFPSSLAFLDGTHGALAFQPAGYHWDPTASTLGDAILPGLDLVAADGRGAFFGTHAVVLDGGATGPLQVLSVPIDNAGTSVIVEDPFTKAGGYVAGIEAWPRR